jgi:RNA 2',3'-cyclic 3'-phosphodiesterase
MYFRRRKFSDKKSRGIVKKPSINENRCLKRKFKSPEAGLDEIQRIFIAIELSPDVRRWLEKARSILVPGMPAGAVRWTNPNGIHLTLKFLGEIPAGRIESIRSAMDQSAAGGKPFSLTIEGLGCFPNIVRPRVVWAGIRREPLLLDLQRRLEDNLGTVGFKREQRAFSPHLTLGRVKDGMGEDQLRRIGGAVESGSMEAPAVMPVDGMWLFRSILRPAGAEYSALYRAEISGR